VTICGLRWALEPSLPPYTRGRQPRGEGPYIQETLLGLKRLWIIIVNIIIIIIIVVVVVVAVVIITVVIHFFVASSINFLKCVESVRHAHVLPPPPRVSFWQPSSPIGVIRIRLGDG